MIAQTNKYTESDILKPIRKKVLNHEIPWPIGGVKVGYINKEMELLNDSPLRHHHTFLTGYVNCDAAIDFFDKMNGQCRNMIEYNCCKTCQEKFYTRSINNEEE